MGEGKSYELGLETPAITAIRQIKALLIFRTVEWRSLSIAET